jgi:hypothetical protein
MGWQQISFQYDCRTIPVNANVRQLEAQHQVQAAVAVHIALRESIPAFAVRTDGSSFARVDLTQTNGAQVQHCQRVERGRGKHGNVDILGSELDAVATVFREHVDLNF